MKIRAFILAAACLLVVACILLRAQNPNTAAFPTTAAVDTDLKVASNKPAVQRTLNGAISNSVTTIVLSSGAGLLAPVVITIDSEIITCTTLTTATLSGCTRAAESTSAASHSNGANVYQYLTAGYINQITAELKAIESNAAARHLDYIAGGGAAQAQTATPLPPVAALADGMFVCWKPTAANTGAGPTLAVSGLTATSITKLGNTALVANDIVTSAIACARYNSSGPRFELQNPQTATGGGGTPIRVCSILVGADNGAVALADADLGPQAQQCKIPAAATVLEITVNADAGTPSVIAGKQHCSTYAMGACTVWVNTNLLSGALAAKASNFDNCSNTGGTTGIDGGTTCAATLQNTSLAAGDWLRLTSGTAGGTAKRVSVEIIYQ